MYTMSVMFIQRFEVSRAASALQISIVIIITTIINDGDGRTCHEQNEKCHTCEIPITCACQCISVCDA